jgi:excisionase family DNA binding protein
VNSHLAYSVGEAAQLVGLSVRSLRYLLSTGKLGFSRFGRRIVIPHTELERLLRQGYCRPQGRIDADEPIRPRTRKALGSHPEGSDGQP